jgi:Domain of unknown function (DUF397)
MSINDPVIGDLQWRKARRSVNNGACVEVASSSPQHILVRDSQNRSGVVVQYQESAWRGFLTTAKKGWFDVGNL